MTAGAALATVLWLGTLARLPAIRENARQRLLWGSLLAGALAVTVALPALNAGRDVPMPAHLLGVFSAYLLLRLISLVTGSGRVARQRALTAAVLAFLVLTGWHGVPACADSLTAGVTPRDAAYWLVLDGYLILILIRAGWACATVRRGAPAGALRDGLLAMGAGSLLLAGYAAGELALVLVRGAGVQVDFRVWQPYPEALHAAGLVLFVAGGTAPPAARLRAVLGAYRTLLVLRPLWNAIRRAFPQVVLMQPARAALVFPGSAGARLRVYRRVIEIRDGMLALREHLPACPAAPPGEDPAVTEARALIEALRRRASGEPPAEPGGAWAVVGPEMADEVAWLSRVSAAYRVLSRQSGARTPRPAGSPR
ncbi:hypothetical protein GCM10010168_61810 [Actinoplanes ianthinogenes]|uniref:DUF6545 domain-containing protein n=1 Tax=Actinoplanes ianthinogenes TaxID=122358 RepID=A0ABN6CN20_9ACTN|nr:MAB_1171c family putative transporter [Actinoplanes ianthinogenes]BCJ46542.1 hypothetical protein Aiant_71990 [Actinoplanes ianthinogenes]GGR34964.1 hypothetical protein GCM10010168_61810 [Actinoplanes ianthinogenes]